MCWFLSLADLLADYRAKTKEYLRLRGKKRMEARKGLEESRELMYEEKLSNIKERISEIGRLIKSERNDEEKKRLSEELHKLWNHHNKLLSRLNHDEWVVYMRSIWTFKEMESDAKTGLHPAQFSAEVPRRLIKLYSFVDDLVLDSFMGTGTTLIEARNLDRRSIGVDVNQHFIEVAKERLSQARLTGVDNRYEPKLLRGDARNLADIADSSVDLIITHPPYWNSVRISDHPDDLSIIGNDQYESFILEMKKVFSELQRVLKPDRVMAIMTGDVLRKVNGETKLFPLHSDYIQILTTEFNFVLWDVFIIETKIRKSGGKPMMGSYPFPHKLFSEFAHNYCLVFRKRSEIKSD